MQEFRREKADLHGITATLATYVFSMLIVFRAWIASGFDIGFGDRADGLIEVSILEHWRNVLYGWSAWNRSFYFFPYDDTIGYNDGYFLYGLVYSLWRTMFDPFISDVVNIITFKTLGFFGALLLCRTSLGLERTTALIVATLFTIANGLLVQAVHAQLESVVLLPIVSALAVHAVGLMAHGRQKTACWPATGLAAVLASWFLTSFYMAWFTVFFALLFGACWLFLSPSPDGRLARCLGLLKRNALPLAAAASTFLLSLTPFLIAYLPKLKETGGHSFFEVANNLVLPSDPTNVGRMNYMWGWIYRGLFSLAQHVTSSGSHWPEKHLEGEHVSGFPLFLFAIIVASVSRALSKRDRGKFSPALRALALALVIGWICTLRLGQLSPWHLVYLLVPGAHGLRVVLRFQLFLILPALVTVALVQRDRILHALRYRPMLASVVVVLLVSEQLGTVASAELSRANQAELLSLPPPPASCSAFYVVKARRNEPVYFDKEADSLYPHNVDAMFLAERWRVPTINGWSTFNSPDWNFAASTNSNYEARVHRYATVHGLKGLCRLDARSAQPWHLALW